MAPTKERPATKTIATNREARHEYFVLEALETGVELKGTEVKSLRAGGVNLKDSWVDIEDGELLVKGMHISPYDHGNMFNQDPMRVRRLLAHKSEIRRLHQQCKLQGYTLVPLSLYMREGGIDLVIVGADRIAANGDTANKIGTYLKALAAADNQIPFYVAAPISTFDWTAKSGGDIPIENRSGDEIRWVRGIDKHGHETEVCITDPGIATVNPGFDVTPARLITGFITDRGVFVPEDLKDLRVNSHV